MIKTKLPKIVFLSLIVFTPLSIFGQISISAEIKPRGEIDNVAVLPLNTRCYISQRTRLSFDFKKSIFQLRLTAQDVRVLGSSDIFTSTGVLGSTSGLDFYEAWLKINILKSLSFRTGQHDNINQLAGSTK
ncbi:MAG: hypothetical protein JEY97_15690 [Bacteroidales bacterium]|nr:hypothetical protein [Bacteroidales bacterium]